MCRPKLQHNLHELALCLLAKSSALRMGTTVFSFGAYAVTAVGQSVAAGGRVRRTTLCLQDRGLNVHAGTEPWQPMLTKQRL